MAKEDQEEAHGGDHYEPGRLLYGALFLHRESEAVEVLQLAIGEQILCRLSHQCEKVYEECAFPVLAGELQ